MKLWLSVVLILALSSASPCVAQPANQDIGHRAYEFFKKYDCIRCHDEEEQYPDFRLDDITFLLRNPNPNGPPPYVDVGSPEKSKIWQRVIDQVPSPMPPVGEVDVAVDLEQAKSLLSEWMEAGAPIFREVKPRRHVPTLEWLKWIRDDLQDPKRRDSRDFTRYFILANQHNNQSVSEESLAYHQAGVAKLINSLSWEKDLTAPQVVDPEGIVLRIDLRWFGWSKRQWSLLTDEYPYGVAHTEAPEIRSVEREIERLTDARIPYLRGDWFVATASRAPLYDELIQLPVTIEELEERLRVNYQKNFDNRQILRAGVLSSKVSRQNRVIERHPGGYWRSFDFDASDRKQNIVVFPLGPVSAGVEQSAFVHIGGEIIFRLPNGLHGYMLADGDDKHLKAPAPVSIVRDLRESAGTPEVVNGLSCFSCHDEGIRTDFVDGVRKNPAVFGSLKEQVRQIYADPAVIKERAERDRDDYLAKVRELAVNYFPEQAVSSRQREPIFEVARRYNADMAADQVAADLFLANTDVLIQRIQPFSDLEKLGLGPLKQGQRIKRGSWERRQGTNLFHLTAFGFGMAKH